jgi:hypothetical protein
MSRVWLQIPVILDLKNIVFGGSYVGDRMSFELDLDFKARDKYHPSANQEPSHFNDLEFPKYIFCYVIRIVGIFATVSVCVCVYEWAKR